MAKQYLAEIGLNVVEARSKLEGILPYPEGNPLYKRLKISVEPLADNRYLARAEYELRPESRQGVVRPATGAVPGELERAVEQQHRGL